MFLVSYEFTFDVGMQLLLLLLQHRQQHLVAHRCENGAVRIGWHNALQDLPSKHPQMVKINAALRSPSSVLDMCSTSIAQLHSCACAE